MVDQYVGYCGARIQHTESLAAEFEKIDTDTGPNNDRVEIEGISFLSDIQEYGFDVRPDFPFEGIEDQAVATAFGDATECDGIVQIRNY